MRVQSGHCLQHWDVHSNVLRRYECTPDASLHPDPHSAGVYRDNSSTAYIKADGRTYAVKFDRDNGTWRIHHPDEPAKTGVPVRRDERGNWEVHHEVGLAGGAPPVRQDVKDKAKALLLEGWSQRAVQHRLDVSPHVTTLIRREIDVLPTAPLASREFREDVVARLNAGVPAARVARDLGVQAETVELIEQAWTKAKSMRGIDALPATPQTLATAAGSAPLSARLDAAQPVMPGGSEALAAGDRTAPTVPMLDIGLACMHVSVDRKTAKLPLTDEVMVKAKTLLRGGWSIGTVEKELGLMKHRLRTALRTAIAVDPGPRVSGAAGMRSPQSPQPGTSTGGWTYPAVARTESVDRPHFASTTGGSQSLGARSEPVPDASQGAGHTPAMLKPSLSQDELADGRIRRTTLSGQSISSSRPEVMDKAKALFLDGWSRKAVQERLGLDWPAIMEARHEVLVPRGAPLTSSKFRERVAAQLDAGIAHEQIARDMNIHPESVKLIREALPPARPGSAVTQWSDSVHRVCRMHQVLDRRTIPFCLSEETRSTIAALLRGGWTSNVIQIGLGVSSSSVWNIKRRQSVPSSMPLNDAAQQVFPPATRRAIDAFPATAPSANVPDPAQPGSSTGGWMRRVRSWPEPVSAHEGASINSTAYRGSAWADTSRPLDPRLRVGAPEHDATQRDLFVREGLPADDADALRSPPLPELSARDVEEQLPADEFADLDMSEFKAMMDSSPL